MSRALVILATRAERERAARWCMTAPVNTRVEFKEAKRTTDQNARMWAMLTDVAQADADVRAGKRSIPGFNVVEDTRL